MKNSPIIFTFIFSMVTFSAVSFAEWTRVAENENGYTFYVDFETIKKQNGYVYFWEMSNYLKPDKWKDMSSKTLQEADCNTPVKARKIYATYHTQPMANGEPSTVSPETRDWIYPPPDSVMGVILEKVCNR